MGTTLQTIIPYTEWLFFNFQLKTLNMVLTGVIYIALLQISGIFSFPQQLSYPDHASCKIDWTVPNSCDNIRSQLINQMNQWKGDSNCGKTSESCPTLPCGQNCLYEYLETEEDGTIKAKHLTPVKRYVDSVNFKFEKQGENSCKIAGFSSSDLWYAYLDKGTNYCNLRNLIDGSGLSGINGFQENTNDSVCTEYTTRDCSRY